MLKIVVVGIILLFLSGGCGPKDIHFAREGAPVEKLRGIDNTKLIKKIWKRDLGASYSNKKLILKPKIKKGILFAAEPNGSVMALDSGTGSIKWKTKLKTKLLAGVGASEKSVVVATKRGLVVNLSAKNGNKRWTADMLSEIQGDIVIAQNKIILRSTNGHVICLNEDSGEVVWRYIRMTPDLSLRGLSTPVVSSNSVIVGLDSGRLSAMSLDSGNEQWTFQFSRSRGANKIDRLNDIDSTPYLINDKIFVSAFRSKVSTIDARSLKTDWSTQISSIMPFGSYSDNLLLTTVSGSIVSLNMDDGSEVWRLNDLVGRGVSQPLGLENSKLIVAGDYQGFLYLISPDDGHIEGKKKTRGGAIINIFSGNRSDEIFVMNENGTLSLWKTASH